MAKKTIKGITVAIGGDTAGLQKALGEVNSKAGQLRSELRQVENALKLDPENTVLLAQKQEILAEQVENTSKKLQTLKSMQERVDEEYKKGNIGSDAYRAFQREIATTESTLTKLKSQQDKVSNSTNKAADSTEDLTKQENKLSNANESASDSTEELSKEQKKLDESTDDTSKSTEDLKNQEDKLKKKSDETKSSTIDFDKALSLLKNTASTAANTMITAAKSVGSVASAVTSGVVSLGKAATDVGKTFDTSMSQVQAISGATGESLDKLRDKAKEMGATTKFTATEAADAFNYMAMAGWKTDDMLDGIEGIMSLAAASGEELATTSDIVTDALTAFGLEAKDSGHFADVLAAASSNANTNVSMLGESFKYVAPAAGTLGYSIEDISLALGLMANNGIKSSQAGTSLNSSLSRLAKPTKEMNVYLSKLGLAMQEVNYTVDQSKVDKAQNKVETATLSVKNAQENLNAQIQKYGTGSTQAVIASNNLEKAKLSLSNAEIDLAKAQKGTAKSAFGANLALTDEEGNMKSLRETLTVLRESFKDLTTAQQEEYASAIFGKNSMSGMLAIINSSEEDFNKLAAAVDNCNGKAKEMANTMLDNLEGDMTLLQSAAEGLGVTFYETFKDKVRGSVQFATNSITDLSETFKSGDIKATAASIGEIMSTALLEMASNASEVGNIAADVIEGFTTGISNNLLKIKISSKKIVQSLIDGTIQMLPSIVDSASEMIGVAAVCVDRFIDGIKKNSHRIGNAAKGIVKALSNGIVTLLPKQLQEPIKQTMSKIEKSFNNGGLKKALDTFKTTISKIGKTVTDITSKSLVPIVDIVDKLTDHIDIIIPAIVAWIAAVKGMGIVNTVNAALTGMTAATTAEQLATAASTGAITLKNIAVGVLTQNITMAEAAQLAWNTAMNANPIGVVIAAVSALAAGIGALKLITDDQTEADKELEVSQERLDQQIQQYNDNLEIYAETLSEVFDKATDFNSGISSAGDCLEGFNGSIEMSTEKQQELSDKMSEVQTEITEIAKRATEERRELTQTEIDRLEELFAKEKELADQQLQVKQEYQNVVKDMAEDLVANESITVEEYEAYAQQYINTAQTTRDEAIKVAQEYKTNYLAEQRARIGTAEGYTQEWYNEIRKNAESEYQTNVDNANKTCADTLRIISNGYYDKSEVLSDYCDKVEEYKQKESKIQTDYDKKIDKIEKERQAAKDKAQKDYSNDYSSNEKILNENLAEIDAEYDKKRADALEEAATKRSNLISDINATTSDKIVQDNLSTWIAMESTTELYSGKMSSKTKRLADNFIDSFEYLDDDTKEQARQAMEGMMQGLEEKEPALYAKADNIATNFIAKIRNAFDIHSPSRVTRKIFTQVIEGGEVGIDKEAPNLYKSADKTAKSFSKRMKLSLSTSDFISKAKTALHNNIDSMTRNLRTNFDINPNLNLVSGDSRMQTLSSNQISSGTNVQTVQSGSTINFTLQIDNFNNTANTSVNDLSETITTTLYELIRRDKLAVI